MSGMAMRRSIFFVLMLSAIAALFLFWPHASERQDSPGRSAESRTNVSSASSVESKTAAPAASIAGNRSSTESRTVPQRRAAQIDVRGPSTVRPGESFRATVDLDADRAIRRLAFTINFKNTILQLLGSSTGTFVQSAGAPAQFEVQEPSDGVVLVSLDVNNGMTIAGAGSVVILEFRATNAGTSPVTVDDITLVENDGGDNPMKPSVRQGLVTVE